MSRSKQYFDEHPEAVVPVVAVTVWSLIWKALALYRAGSNKSPGWFTALLFINTVGILEMLYLFVFGRKKRRVARLGDDSSGTASDSA